MFPSITVNTEYLIERLTSLGITDDLNTFRRAWKLEADEKCDNGKIINHKKEHTRDYKLFEADESGNIIIRYFNLDGQPYRWKKEDTKQSRDFIRKRLRDPNSDFKYWQDKGSPQFPYFNPGIIKKYRINKDSVHPDGTAPQPIDTLFITEGEFKSYSGYLAGLDIIGIPSIHGFYDSDVKGKLNEDIKELILTCQVKKIVYLVDADLMSITWAEGKDLAKRPESFFTAIKNFRESIEPLLDNSNVALELAYFMHVETKFMNDAKGLDDLLGKYTSVREEIVSDLKSLREAKKYFRGFFLNDLNKDLKKIRTYLGLSSSNPKEKADEHVFYEVYKDFIGAREFLFRNRRYEYDPESREVKYVRHQDADRFMRIGPDWFKVITKTDKYGDSYDELKVWKIGEINRDYAKKFPDFLDQVQRYDDFTNEPSWNGSYQRVIKNCYNLCWPLKWDCKSGEFNATIEFLKHIFQGKAGIENNIEGDPFSVALDWLTIFHQQPKQALPVIVLVSKENETGKSTLMKWLRTIYGSNNAVILSNEEFKMSFNGHYISKSLIMVDEGFLDVDKKSEKERLKKLITSDTAYIEYKGADLKQINYYAKMLISSNDDERVMKIDDVETRWFVVKVPVPKEKDPDLEIKLREEIPAWLEFINKRPVFHKRESRLWFKPEHIITEQFKVVVEATKHRLDRIFEEWITQMFKITKKPSLQFSRKFILQQLAGEKNDKLKYKIDEADIKNMLEPRGYKLAESTCYVTSPKLKDEAPQITAGLDSNALYEPNSAELIDWMKYSARPYTFQASDWIKPTVTGDDLPF